MEIDERKRIENILIGFRWVALLFLFFLIPMNLNISSSNSTQMINRLLIFLVFGVVYTLSTYIAVRLCKHDKNIDTIIIVVSLFDIVAIFWGATIVLEVCELPMEFAFIILQVIMLIRYRSTLASLLANAILFLNIWTYEFILGVRYYPEMWEVRGIFWSIILVFNLSIFWHILRDYDKIMEQKELEKFYLEHSKKSIDNLIHINKISAALNGSLSQNEIIKILLKNISVMADSDDCAVLLYSKREGEGYIYKYSEFKKYREENEPIGYATVTMGDEIKKIKCMKDYKHVVGSYQPFYMIDLVNIYNMKVITLNSNKKHLYMFKIMCSMKEGGFLIIAADEQIQSEIGQFISLLVGQGGTALTTAVLYNSVKRKANTDPLTGAKTRRYLKDFLKKEIERSRRHNKRFCVLFFDIDNFKSFNDTYGHKIGDEVLKIIHQVAKKTIRKIDLVSRYGGEEFVVVLPETEYRAGYVTAERIRKSIENYPLQEQLRVDRNVTVSIGISEYGVDGHTEEDLINKADWGMYEAKSQGRNQVCSFRNYKEDMDYQKSK